MSVNLFSEYYLSPHPQRQAEIDYCLVHNGQNSRIKNFFVIVHNSQEEELVRHLCPTCQAVEIDLARPTIGQLFSLINQISLEEDVNILANSDIFFDESLSLLDHLQPEQAVCLSRWNVLAETEQNFKVSLQYNPQQSQDSWIFRGKMKKELESLSFTTGKMKCDNALAAALAGAGYQIFNPSLSLKSYHLHRSEVRNYSLSDFVAGPYSFVSPCYWSSERGITQIQPWMKSYLALRFYSQEIKRALLKA